MSGRGIDRRSRPSSARARWGTTLRASVGATALLSRRRARRDAPLLVGWIALLCLAALLALAIPRLVLDTVDRGARAAVAEVGAAADLVVRTQVGDPRVSSEYVELPQVVELADLLPSNLPDGLARVAGSPAVSVLSPDLRLAREGADGGDVRVQGQFGLLGPDQERDVTVVEGRLPDAAGTDSELEVVVSRETADAASLTLGTGLLAAGLIPTDGDAPVTVVARVVGIVDRDALTATARCLPEWCDLPTMWAPGMRDSRAGGSTATVTLLTGEEGIEVAGRLFLEPLVGSVRLPLVAERFTSELVTTVVDETDALEANSSPLSANSPATVDVRTEFPDALREYAAQAAASVAQMSLMIAGLFGTVAAVILLVGGLLVRRRSADLALERARGSSLGSVVVRGLSESVVLALVGAGSGAALAAVLLPGPVVDPAPLVAVVAVAVLAPPAQAFLVAREAWSGRRQPANRRDRQQLAGRARGRRVVLEVAVVVLAVAALVSVRNRGLVEARTEGTDPLLAAAPLLLAVAVTVVVLRLQPLVVRAATALASRSRGAVGLLGAAHAQRSVAALPLFALTLTVAIVVGGALIVQTVREGQVDASWQRVGADARVEGVIDGGTAADVRDAPGVDAASAIVTRTKVEIDSGASSASASVVAVDSGYAEVAERLPAGAAPRRSSLDELAAASVTDGALPVLVDARLADRLAADDVVMVFDDERIPLRVVGTVDGGPDGYLAGPFLYADLAALSELVADAPVADTLLVMGDGAAAAARSAAGDDAHVVTRVGWIDDRRAEPLVQGVDRMTQLTVAMVALLAAIALVTTVAASARSRARSLSLLRTLGVGRGFGWTLAVAELTPLVVAALVGGAVAGAAILLVVAPALGLRLLAGGAEEPALHLDPWTVVLVVAGSIALSLVAIVVDMAAHRRDQPGDVLRVGETT